MVKELKIENPDFQGFLKRFNEYIEQGGDGFACIQSETELLSSRTAQKFCVYLLHECRGTQKETLNKILKQACGDRCVIS